MPFHFRLPRNEQLLLLGVLLAIAAFWGGLSELVGRWYRQEEYSHGFFLPLISLFLLWYRRDVLRKSRGAPSGWGLVLLVVSALLLVLGEVTALFLAVQIGFLIALVGLVLCYGGVSLLRVAWMPIAFLLFAIPLPYFIDSQISWRLQLMSSSLGVGLLRLMGYAVYLEGNVIDLGSYKLQVVEACSGLRYLYPLLSLSFLMAYIYPAKMRWRVLVFLSAVPITVLTNSARIAMVGVLVARWGSGMADGFLHYFEGWVIFLVCQLILMAEIWVIERFTLRRGLLEVQQQIPLPPVARPTGIYSARWSRPLVAAMVLLAAGMAAALTVGGRTEVKPLRHSLVTFPLELGNWRATESSLSIEVEQALGFSDYVLADYRDEAGDVVNFYTAYYASQRKGVSPHSPQVCIPGGGWVISDIHGDVIELNDGSPLEVVRVVISKDNRHQLVYYWFEQRGRRIANEYLMKWYLLEDALLRNRTDGALVRMVTPMRPGEAAGAADARLTAFARVAVPLLGPFVPK
ncbi:VPLPA-CTERM-specific exosortase XrtD [Comamonas flocculans]|uniref:VPLPA-CTERM-specific exosortase XrtD n=1 Tax=Comamonas flocculans TaxID=2597701 RepID=UPI0016465AAA|nr:VPLPA-CTERM-specific exosortase XrtD [Comamonas flocculans]